MAIAEGYKKNFEMLKLAFSHGDVALMETTDKKTGKPAVVICAVQLGENEGETEFVPFAKMFDGNPYLELLPPS